MNSRGIRSHGARLVTRRILGAYHGDGNLRRAFPLAIGMGLIRP
jgi:hypothetical protein